MGSWQDEAEPVETNTAPAGHWTEDAEPVGPELVRKSTSEGPTLGAGSTGLMHFARHLAFGLGDKIIAAEQALSDKLHDKTGGTTFSDAYARNLKANDALLEASDQVHNTARWIGNGSGFVGNLAALAAVAPARAALAARGLVPAAETAAPAIGTMAGVLQGATQGAKLGTIFGAVGGYGGSRSDSLGGTLADTAIGGAIGGVGGGLLGAVTGGISGKLVQRAQPRAPDRFVEALQQMKEAGDRRTLPMIASGTSPIPEAQVLQRYGVPLTLRQMNPEGPLAEISEASERVPFLGRYVQAQERAPIAAWRDVALRQAMPGEGPMVNGDVADKLGDIQRQIGGLYRQVADAPAKIAAVHPDTGELVNPVTAFKAILGDPNYQAGDSDLRIVKGVLDDQLSKLYRATDGGKSINAGILMDMRSHLRQAAQDAIGQDGGFARSQMFRDAADSLTGGLKASLSPTDLATLNRADAAYSNFSRLTNAARRAASQIGEGEFSPQRLSSELAQAYGRKFATDSEAGGSLRELAKAGKVVFTPRDVKTGFGESLKAPIGLTLGHLITAANRSPTAQAAFMAAARRAAEASQTGMAEPAAGALEAALTGYLQKLPAGSVPATTLGALLGARPQGPP